MCQSGSCWNRRQFLRVAAAAVAAPVIVPASAMGRDRRVAPSERITLGIVGVGSRGFNLVDSFLDHADAQIVAVCDVDSLHYRDRKWGQGRANGLKPAVETVDGHYAKQTSSGTYRACGAYADFRQLYAKEDLDAVVVATPDHWHAVCALQALSEGKDVYCEKPVTHLFREGQMLYQEVAKQKAVFQTGSQQRSDARFRHAVELVLNGHLGKIRKVEVGLSPGYPEPQGDATVQDPPEHLNYELWCGPAPRLPYMRARHHRWWRGHLAFGGGVLMDWIGHHNDIAHWSLGMDRSGPTKVEAVNWTFPQTEVYNTPHHYEIRCEYAGGVTSTISDVNRSGTKWIGEEGWVFVTRGRLEASDRRWTNLDFEPGSIKVYESPEHTRNFLDCVKSRRPCVAPAETAHRSITPGHLGYVSNAVGRPLRWDPEHERVIGDDQADKLLKAVSYRKPWTP